MMTDKSELQSFMLDLNVRDLLSEYFEMLCREYQVGLASGFVLAH
ncbi:MAG: hypothetical protein AB1757_27835 [Acidobacteriota bacterium]